MSKGQLIEEGLTREVVGCFYDVYDEFGFGFLENVYSKALVREMGWKDLRPVREFEPKFYRRILTNDMKKSRNKIPYSPDGYP